MGNKIKIEVVCWALSAILSFIIFILTFNELMVICGILCSIMVTLIPIRQAAKKWIKTIE